MSFFEWQVFARHQGLRGLYCFQEDYVSNVCSTIIVLHRRQVTRQNVLVCESNMPAGADVQLQCETVYDAKGEVVRLGAISRAQGHRARHHCTTSEVGDECPTVSFSTQHVGR